MDAMIQIQNLRIDYDETNAVKALSLTIPRGQVYGFVGPNGAGKTSTIKALAGVLEATFGTIHLNGCDLETQREQALAKVGYMPDFSPVYEMLKVWEYLDVFAASYGIESEERGKLIEEWLAKVGLAGKRDVLVKELSRGMRQRLVLAKTLLPKPLILLLDEPASGLDPASRRQMRDLLKEAAQGGATIIISSHILSELSDLCDAVGILEKGNLVVSGSLDQIRSQMAGAQKMVVEFLDAQQSVEHFWAQIDQWGIPRSGVSQDKGKFLVDFSRDESVAADFLKQLIARGAAIKNFGVEKDDIEDIFFKIGAKEVA